jgi:hypothetical protein
MIVKMKSEIVIKTFIENRSCHNPTRLFERLCGMIVLLSRLNCPCVAAFYFSLGSMIFLAESRGFYAEEELPWVTRGEQGELIYRADERGNTIPDFSRAGYRGGMALPDVATLIELDPSPEGDDRKRIQDALDEIGQAPADEEGRRGSLLLKQGTFRVSGSLHVPSGVVIRGEGSGESGTLLLAIGGNRRPFILFGEDETPTEEIPGTRQMVTDSYVPWSALTFSVEDAGGFQLGDRVEIFRPGTEAWIRSIGMDRIAKVHSGWPNRRLNQWQPEEYDFVLERTIVAVEGNEITIDAPLMIALDEQFGGGYIYRIQTRRAVECGIESIRLDTEFKEGGEKTDLNRAGPAVRFQAVENAWARDVVVQHLDSGFNVRTEAIFVTIADCAHLDPVGPIRGGYRTSYSVWGQYVLVKDSYTRNSRHAFATGARSRGPNVFLDGVAEKSHDDSGPHQRFAIGTLYDNISDDAMIRVHDRGDFGTGHGWTGAQHVMWNCVTPLLAVQSPPGSKNYVIGGKVSRVHPGRFRDRPQGSYYSLGTLVEPRSLYRAQLRDRLGDDAVD